MTKLVIWFVRQSIPPLKDNTNPLERHNILHESKHTDDHYD